MIKAFHGDESPLYRQISHQSFQIIANNLLEAFSTNASLKK